MNYPRQPSTTNQRGTRFKVEHYFEELCSQTSRMRYHEIENNGARNGAREIA
jgi:hypothetical protein